ncbi:DsbA family protein [Aestuariispira insulae]|uniref:Thioredoxin-like protein n=1 Tax=Aestuariispira insulae TaxID=1461337 RepID=A0A3D9HXN8_9PROT|nr:DsbA family protein [Aestuariispira insulae]RED54272.1 thioredoxin-like protein [Aestuariispira insulae]
MRRILSVLFFCLIGAMAQAQETETPLAVPGDRVLGDPNAPVTIMEFSSLTCPHCASFHKNTLPLLKEKYIDTGKVKLVYKDYPIGGKALRAAMLARCVAPSRYFQFLDVLFKQQESWAWEENPDAYLIKLGKLAGVSESKFAACVDDKAVRDGVLKSYVEGSRVYKVDATPSFIINGEDKISGAEGIEAFDEILEKYLEE